ncbi:SPOR domain-containing protein [Thiomicrospira sp. ALE5]|uniref:SPOR domain-containing protein n=1 Tax=Thiomicrospira sp. ALE5 TaxID=748650 RepID=UPI0008E34C6F|nr:SPOR domain-containing protein [Thiomicrospira sp. ALE5]SFR49917.1 DamX protein [Thiomicrospira sp. ALE5]
MSKSISQLAEEERARLLEAIETQANRISTKRDPDHTEVSLSDWLNAAEKVIPQSNESIKPGAKVYQASQQETTVANNKTEPTWDELFDQQPKMHTRVATDPTPSATKATSKKPRLARSNSVKNSIKNPAKTGPYFGVVVMLGLLLAMTGILYLAYLIINEEFERFETILVEQEAQILQLETQLMDTQMLLEDHEDAPIVISLMERLAVLEASQPILGQPLPESAVSQEQLDALATAQQRLQQQLEQALATPTPHSPPDLIAQLDQQIIKRIQELSQQSPQHTNGLPELAEIEISAPKAPTMPTEPVIAEVTLTEEPAKTTEVADVTTAPLHSPRIMDDIRWIEQQAGSDFVIQLAAMVQAERLEQIIRQHNLTQSQTRILPQVRNGQTRYILIMGSYDQRRQAVEKADLIKDQTGITPWVRRVNDINSAVR